MMITLSFPELFAIILCVMIATASLTWAVPRGGRRIAKTTRGGQQNVPTATKGSKRSRGDDADAQAGCRRLKRVCSTKCSKRARGDDVDAQAGGVGARQPKRVCFIWHDVTASRVL